MLKLDFWLLQDNSYNKERFSRRKKVHLFNQAMTFATPEDTILIKLLWYKNSRSEKHFIDAAFVYQIQEEKLDKEYLAKWAREQKTTRFLREIAGVDLEQHY
jgi:hypothetical protein